MAHAQKLTVAEAQAFQGPGKLGDGDGLWLIARSGRRAWHFHYMRAGKAREMSLGNADLITLAEARNLHREARLLLARGIDPLEQRREQAEAEATGNVPAHTFTEAAAAFIAAHAAGWRNAKHAQQWRNTLATYAEPIIGTMVLGAIDTNDVLRILMPLWAIKPETASRVRSRIENVLDYAKARGWRDGPNPALWRGNLQLLLPAKGKVRKVEHHAALDWREAPDFWRKLAERDGMGVRALRFAILTAVRSGEVRGATWSEIDLDAAIWTIPAARMKAERAHRVPLAGPAVSILRPLAEAKDGSGLVFFGLKRNTPLSDMTLTAVLRRMGRGDLTAHGFRSTFRDWAAETTAHPNHVVELALAHAIGDKVEAAYRRGDLFEKRAALMADWGAFLARPAGKVLHGKFGPRKAPGAAGPPEALA
jgi:integrase